MYRNNTKNITFGMLALVVSVVAIGLAYAGFTGTLNINGTGNVVSSKWDIYFANLSNAVTTGTANVVTPATISPKTKIGDYYVELASPGDSVTYTFDVVNDGDFDAVLTTLTKGTPTCTPTATLCNYLTYTLKYTSNNRDVAENDTLLKGETKNMTLKLTLDPNMPASALSSTELSVSGLGITLLYSQNSAYGGNPAPAASITFVNRQNEGQITAGDEVAIDSEHFYVVSSDSTNTVLLAKYNLLVGDAFDYDSNNGYTLNKILTSSDTGYGLQNSTARGHVDGANQSIGIVPFSGTNYWDNSVCQYTGTCTGCPYTGTCTGESGLSAGFTGNYETGNPYPEVYRSNMSSTVPSINYTNGYGVAQNNGYTIAYYVEEYVNTLKELGAPETITGRLLKQEEAVSLGCNEDGNCASTDDYETGITGTAPSWVYSTSYWLGSAYDYGSVWCVESNGVFDANYFSDGIFVGVRPVIIVSTSDI